MSLYENVKDLANRKGMSLPDLAEKMGLVKTAIYKWKTQTPNIETIEKLAKYFDVSIEFLIGSDHVPEWTTNHNMIELDLILKNNISVGYGGRELTDAEKIRVKTILDTVFWDKI